jgi:aminoglycoside phosphotransferase
MPRQPQKP